MKRIERCSSEPEGLSVSCRCEHIDRIPNASLFEKAVKACEYRHGHASREASLNSRGHRIRFEWQQRPGEIGCNWQPFNFAPRSGDHGRIHFDFNRLLPLVREDVPE